MKLGLEVDLPNTVDSVAAGNTVVRELDPAVIAHEVVLYDETLRDGEQTVGVVFKPDEKIEIAQGLLDAGVRYLTAGFPGVSEAQRKSVAEVVKLSPKTIACFARSTAGDIESVVSCGASVVILFIPISDVHLERKLRISADQAFDRMQQAVQLAVGAGLAVRFGLEDATRAPLDRVARFVTGAVDAGASTVGFADTCGVLTPVSAYRFTQRVVEAARGTKVTIHCHNDLGMAVANTLAGITAGATYAQSTLLGLGERAGNACLEELAAILALKYGIATGVDLDKLCRLAYRVSDLARFPVAQNKPLLGRNVFAHESGIHVHGLTREPACYEPFPPRMVGRAHEIVFGTHSGVASLAYLAELEGLTLAEDRLLSVLAQVKRRGDELREAVPVDEVRRLLREAAAT